MGMADDFLATVRAPEFTALWSACARRYVPWSEFAAMPQPPGFAAAETWALVSALRHRTANELPFDNYVPGIAEPDNWFCTTEEMHGMLVQVAAQASEGSELDSYLRDGVCEQSRALLLAGELCSAARRDGIELDESRVRDLWSGRARAASPEDRLAQNFKRELARVGSSPGRALGVAAVEGLNERLLDGVSFASPPRQRPRMSDRKPSRLDDPDEALREAAALCRGLGPRSRIHPVFRSMLASGVMWEFSPFEAANAVTEVLVRSAFYLQEGLPVLRWVPFSKLSERWEAGTLARPELPSGYLDYVPDCGEGYDSTGHFTCELRLLLHGLAKLRGRLEQMKEGDEGSVRAFAGEADLNPRQRDVCVFAARNPEWRTTFAEHRDVYKVSYATAHEDLEGLERRGFLSRVHVGRAHAFQATPFLLEFARAKAREKG